MADDNPWLRAAPPQSPTAALTVPAAPRGDQDGDAALHAPPTTTGPKAPQPYIPPGPGPALPRNPHPHSAPLWWLGVHGGAGETTLAHLSRNGQAAEHAWPIVKTEQPTVVLVARTHYHGLMRVRQAATEWARGEVDARLLGLVFIASAPGRTPKPLREFAQLVAGAVPRVWRIPWVEAWQIAPADIQTAPRSLRRMLVDTESLISPTS